MCVCIYILYIYVIVSIYTHTHSTCVSMCVYIYTHTYTPPPKKVLKAYTAKYKKWLSLCREIMSVKFFFFLLIFMSLSLYNEHVL